MRWAFAKALWLVAWGLNFVMWGHLYIAWQAGADVGRLLLMFFAYVIPICAMLSLRGRLREAPQRPKKVKVMPTPQRRQEPFPEPPQRAQERRFAVPPMVRVPITQTAIVQPSMPDRLRRFVVEGCKEVNQCSAEE